MSLRVQQNYVNILNAKFYTEFYKDQLNDLNHYYSGVVISTVIYTTIILEHLKPF